MHDDPTTEVEVSDHLADARHRARQMLGGESHLGPVDDWRLALVSARDAVILVWLTWVALHGLSDPPFTGSMLVVMAIAYLGVGFAELFRRLRVVLDSGWVVTDLGLGEDGPKLHALQLSMPALSCSTVIDVAVRVPQERALFHHRVSLGSLARPRSWILAYA